MALTAQQLAQQAKAKADIERTTNVQRDPADIAKDAKTGQPVSQAKPTGPVLRTFSQDYAARADKSETVAQFRERTTGSAAPTAAQTTQQADLSAGIKAASQDRNRAAAEKQGQVIQEGEVFDPQAALRDRAVRRDLGQEPGNVRQFINEGQAKAIRGGFEEQVGPQPQAPKPPEGGYASEEDRLKAENSYKTQLAEWYRQVGEVGQKELGTVSTQVSDFSDQLTQNQTQIESLVANLNQSNPGFGNSIQSAIDAIKKSGGTGDLSPELMADLTELADSGISQDEFQAQAQTMISSAFTPGTAAAAGITATASGYTLPSGATIPKGADGKPNLSALIGSDATGMDLAYMESAMASGIAGKGLEMDMRAILNYANSEARAYETTKQEIAAAAKHSEGRVEETIIKAMNEIEFNRAQTEMAKADKLEDMTADFAKQEGYWRAQLEAWGADESTAAMSLQFKNKINFMKEYDRTEADYDLRLQRYNQLDMEARMAAGNRYLEIADKKNIANEKANNMHMDAIDKILTGTQDAYANRDIKLMDANKELFSTVRGIQAAAEEARTAAEKDSRDFAFDLAKEFTDNGNFQWTVEQNADGSWNTVNTGRRKATKGSGGGGTNISVGITGSAGSTPGGYQMTGNLGNDTLVKSYIEGEDLNSADRSKATALLNAQGLTLASAQRAAAKAEQFGAAKKKFDKVPSGDFTKKQAKFDKKIASLREDFPDFVTDALITELRELWGISIPDINTSGALLGTQATGAIGSQGGGTDQFGNLAGFEGTEGII